MHGIRIPFSFDAAPQHGACSYLTGQCNRYRKVLRSAEHDISERQPERARVRFKPHSLRKTEFIALRLIEAGLCSARLR